MCRIQVVEFRDLQLWDFKSNFFGTEIFKNPKFPLTKISEFLRRNKTQILVKDDEIYKRITISGKILANGAFIRDIVYGKAIGVKKQFEIKKGQFLVSKIGASDGAFGIATQELDGAIITADFWAFDYDKEKIDPYFLLLLVKDKNFLSFVKSASSGTALKRLDEAKFLNSKIPLPPLEKQREIVASLQDLQDKIAAKEAEQSALKERIESHIYGALGLQKQSQAPKQRVFVVNFKDLERWDTSFNQTHAINVKSQNLAEITAPKFSLVKLGEMCGFRRGPFGGSLKKEIFVNQGYKVYEQQHAIKNNFEIGRYFISKDKFEEMRNFEVLPNDLIMSCSGTIGKIAIASENIQKGIINQALLRLRILNFQSVRVDFLKIVLEYVLNDTFQQNSYGSAIKNITSVDTLKNLQIPLPPLEIQRKIVQEIENLQSQISALNEQIAKHENAKQTLTHNLLW